VAVFISGGNSWTVILTIQLGYIEMQRMGLVKLVWVLMGAGKNGWLMNGWFIIVSFRLGKAGLILWVMVEAILDDIKPFNLLKSFTSGKIKRIK
jgi:hypothetical protein